MAGGPGAAKVEPWARGLVPAALPAAFGFAVGNADRLRRRGPGVECRGGAAQRPRPRGAHGSSCGKLMIAMMLSHAVIAMMPSHGDYMMPRYDALSR